VVSATHRTKFDILEDNIKVARMLQVFSSIERSVRYFHVVLTIIFSTQLNQAVKQLQSAKRMILVENILEWKQWKLYVSYVTSYLVCGMEVSAYPYNGYPNTDMGVG